MYVPVGLLMTCFFQCILNYYRIIIIPLTLLTMTGGFIWGTILEQSSLDMVRSSTTLTDFPPTNLAYLYLVITTFKIAFCSDSRSFRKCIGQILIISVPICMLTGIITGTMAALLLDRDWAVQTAILFGILCCPTHSVFVVRVIRTISTKTKYVDVLLEGEALLSTSVMMIFNTLCMGYINGFVEHWYQYTLLSLRFVVIGLLGGYLFGLIGICAIRTVYDDVFCVVTILSCFGFISFYSAQIYFNGDGVIAVALTGLMMGSQRKLLPKKLDERLTTSWKMLSVAVEFCIASYISLCCAIFVMKYIDWKQYVKTMVVYCLYYFTRFACFVIFLPILRKLKFGMDFHSVLVCVWCGIKNPISPVLVVANYHYGELTTGAAQKFFYHIVCLIYLSNMLNATLASVLLKYLGLTDISRTRRINMSNCMRHIFEKRDRVIAMLKMDRFLGDTNWPLVNCATDMKHPFKASCDPEYEDDFFLGYRYTTCPDCKRELIGQPTSRELAEMKREAQTRILKTKKISYSQQYERGMVSKVGVGILMKAVELAIESDIPKMTMDLTRKFQYENCCHQFIKKRAKKLEEYKITVIRPPRKYFRRLCYYLVTNKHFDYFMYTVILLNMIPISVDTYYHSSLEHKAVHTVKLFYVLTGIGALFYLIYLSEFIMKVLAFSWIRVSQGLVAYFNSNWNILDFTVLCAATIENFVLYLRIALTEISEDMSHSLWVLSIIIEIIRFLRLLRLLRICGVIYPKVIKFLDKNANSQMTTVYELGKAYTDGEAEVLELLPFIIDHVGIREELRHEIEERRLIIVKLLGLVQKDRPWIAITVKTKQAIRTVLASMKEAINQLKILGWANDFEHTLLTKELGNLYRQVNDIKVVEPSAPKIIFKEVPWMAEDEKIIDFLFKHVTVKKFEPDDIVMDERSTAEGIYIVVTGLLKLAYNPDSSILNDLTSLGRLPIVDYISSTQYQENVVDYIVSGNCVGELSILTKRPYNCVITAVTHTQVYVLSQSVIAEAMQLSPDPAIGLECRMWKAESIRIALPILMAVPAYHSSRQEQIKYTLERAFVPNLKDYKTFLVTDLIQDIILIEGVVADYNTREILTAPRYIPRTIQKIILPSNSLMNVPVEVETKLLIIPELEFDGIDVMLIAEDTCDKVDPNSISLCLQNVAHNRIWRLEKLRENMDRHRKIKATDGGDADLQEAKFLIISKDNLEQSVRGDLSEEELIEKEIPQEESEKKDSGSFYFM